MKSVLKPLMMGTVLIETLFLKISKEEFHVHQKLIHDPQIRIALFHAATLSYSNPFKT